MSHGITATSVVNGNVTITVTVAGITFADVQPEQAAACSYCEHNVATILKLEDLVRALSKDMRVASVQLHGTVGSPTSRGYAELELAAARVRVTEDQFSLFGALKAGL
jgi:hypothetical protein